MEGTETEMQTTVPIENSQDADDSDAETFHKSCWKRDRRLHPVSHIPRLQKEEAALMHKALVKKKELGELKLVGDEDGDGWGKRCFDASKTWLPVLTWFPELIADDDKWETIKADVISGLTVGVMAIPQSMSYADIAGLEYVYGMYSIFITCLVYGLTGNSRQLGVGPVAMVSLIVEAGLQEAQSESECPAFYNDNPDGLGQAQLCQGRYQELVFTCSFLVGVINIVGGLLNLGFLVNFLAHPVVSGFTSGAAIIIGLSQVKYVFGFEIEKSQYIYVTVGAILENISDTKFMVFLFGAVWIIGLGFLSYASKNWENWKPLKPFGPLIFCTVAIIICFAAPTLTDDYDVAIVKKIPEGVPPVSIDKWDFGAINTVLSTAISASLIGYMESISIGKALAAKHQYKIDAGGEMVALGITNLIGAAFSCYPVTGSFSRSAVNDTVGAKTQLAGLVTSFTMFLTLLVLTPLFYYLPKFALAAIVINSVKNLVAYDEALHLWKVKRSDFVLWVCAFIGTLFLGIQLGIGLAVILSLFLVIHETVRPQVVVLWRLPHSHVYSSIKTTTHGSFTPGILVLRFMGSIYFANCTYVVDRIDQILEDVQSLEFDESNRIKFVIISLSACTSVDTSAIHALKDVAKDLKKKNIKLVFAQVGNRVFRTFMKSGFLDKIGEEWFHDSCHDAVQHCLAYDSSHITDEHHYDNHEKSMKPLTRQETEGLNVATFGVHV